jgi:hypothetical protein
MNPIRRLKSRPEERKARLRGLNLASTNWARIQPSTNWTQDSRPRIGHEYANGSGLGGVFRVFEGFLFVDGWNNQAKNIGLPVGIA